jgi:hypothetical protein
MSNRVPVPVTWLWDNPDLDENRYLYNVEKDCLGLDPWRTITGLDKTIDGDEYIVEFGSTGEKKVSGSYVVYVLEKDFKKYSK